MIITIFYVLIYINLEITPTKYHGNETMIQGYIDAFKLDGNHLTIVLMAKEKIIVNYYIKKETEYLKIKDTYQLGDYLTLIGTLKRPNQNTNFNLFNYQHYLLSEKIYWTFSVDQISKYQPNQQLTYQLKNKLVNYLNQYQESSYLKSFILGETNLIDQVVTDSYRTNGISYLFGTSGLYLTMMAMFLLSVFNRVIKRTIISYGLVIIMLLLYMFLTHYTVSSFRALSFFSLMFINRTFNLSIKPLNLLFLVLAGLLLTNPYLIYSVGLQFTFMVSFYLNQFKSLIKRQKNYLGKIAMISLMAFLSGLPLLIRTNFTLNLITPPINIVFVPLITLIIFPLIFLVLIIPFLSPILINLLKLVEFMSLSIERYSLPLVLASTPLFITLFYYLLITFCFHKIRIHQPRYLLILLLVLLIHSRVANFNKYPTITMFDVGQGDALLITLPNNRGNILVDTGGQLNFNQGWQKGKAFSLARMLIIPSLKARGIHELDYLILTHGDYDHMGEAINLINNFKVKCVLMNSGHNNELELNLIAVLKEKKINYQQISRYNFKINNYLFMLINKQNLQDENSDSLILYTKLNNYTLLLMGDASIENELVLSRTYPTIKADILKIGHHGSKYSSDPSFIKLVKPQIALISVGKTNLYGHPHPSTLNNLKGVKTYLSSLSGSVQITLKPHPEIITGQ